MAFKTKKQKISFWMIVTGLILIILIVTLNLVTNKKVVPGSVIEIILGVSSMFGLFLLIGGVWIALGDWSERKYHSEEGHY